MRDLKSQVHQSENTISPNNQAAFRNFFLCPFGHVVSKIIFTDNDQQTSDNAHSEDNRPVGPLAQIMIS